MKTQGWIVRIGTFAMGLAVLGFCMGAASAPEVGSADATTAGKDVAKTTDPPFFLNGTLPLQNAQVVVGVDGNPSMMIDQSQYDQARDYFLRRIAATPAEREKLWQPVFSSPRAYESSLNHHRQRLGEILGVVAETPQKAEVKVLAETGGVQIEEIKIPLDVDFGVQALVFRPEGPSRKPAIIAIADADESPEEFAGIASGMTTAKWLRELLGRGVTVAIPQMVERRADHPLCLQAGGHDRRRILWRLGFIAGRTLVGMEVQQVTALGDFLAAQPDINAEQIGVWGEGQGGMTALYAAAMDEGLAGATVQDYFQPREQTWKEPVDRVLYGQLNEFGDAEIAALVAPRPLRVVTRSGGAISFDDVQAEMGRAERFYQGLGVKNKLLAREDSGDAEEASADETASMLGVNPEKNLPEITFKSSRESILQMRNEHFEALYRYTQRLCAESTSVRTEYWKLASAQPQQREEKAEKLRQELADLEGTVPLENIPLRPRTLLIGETDKFLAYEVVLDVVPGVEAYGHLLVPRSVAGQVMDKRLPALVCQHGFGGAPKYISGVGDDVETNDHFYHRFGERLAERGYVVFAPYLTVPTTPEAPSQTHRADLVNPIVREAASVGMMRTSLELAKLHRIVDFLQSLPFIDGERIGYYGLSYGGYSASWMPPLESRLKFTIISGHFNEWRQELTVPVEGDPSHYWELPDEDFYNWNVLNRFTHTELVAAMWPRPVCIEWGLQDGTTTPARHRQAWEDLKENFIDPWNMTDKVVNEDYVGPHAIHGIGTFFFVDRWLRPERPAERDYGCDGEHYCDENVAPGFHGYEPSAEIPYVTQQLDSLPESAIRGRFYVSDLSQNLTGMELKVSRLGHPGDLMIELGSQEGGSDLGELRIAPTAIYPSHDLWYELKLQHPIHLDSKKLYWFEVRAASGHAPQDAYLIYGPRPLGGTDYPHNFGLSFRILAQTANEFQTAAKSQTP